MLKKVTTQFTKWFDLCSFRDIHLRLLLRGLKRLSLKFPEAPI